MIDPKTFAESTLLLLQSDPRNYRNFAEYWFFVKALMKRYYTRDNHFILGDYVDQSVADRMPGFENLQEALAAAVETYRSNAAYGMGTSEFVGSEGEQFVLTDSDAGGL